MVFLCNIIWLYLVFVIRIVFIIILYFYTINNVAFGNLVDLFTNGDPFVDVFDEKRILFRLKMLQVVFTSTKPPFRLFELSEAL